MELWVLKICIKIWDKPSPKHGGSDPGASSGDIIEKDYTLKISKYMYDRFKELGVPVFITRSEDITLNPNERINKIKPNVMSGDDIVISNHLNAGGADGQSVTNSCITIKA